MDQRSTVTINKLVILHARRTLTILYRITDGVHVEMVIQLSPNTPRSLKVNAEALGVLEGHGEILFIRHVPFKVRKHLDCFHEFIVISIHIYQCLFLMI